MSLLSSIQFAQFIVPYLDDRSSFFGSFQGSGLAVSPSLATEKFNPIVMADKKTAHRLSEEVPAGCADKFRFETIYFKSYLKFYERHRGLIRLSRQSKG